MEKPNLNRDGVEKFLNDTADEHDGFGWADFESFIRKGLSDRAIAKLMKTTHPTVGDWRRRWKILRGIEETSNV